MSDGLYFVPPRGAFIDLQTGELTKPAVMFMRQLFSRVGGSLGPSTSDLAASAPEDAGIEEIKAQLASIGDAASSVPIVEPEIQRDLLAELSALREEVAELAKTVQGLQSGLLI